MVDGQVLKLKVQVQDSHHEHLLVLGDTAEITAAACGVCKEPCSGATFACDSGDQCRFYAHKSCIRSPEAVENPFHRHTLQPSRRLFTCEACLERFIGDCYGCPDCSMWFDLECALRVPEIPPGLEGQEQIHHADHLHPLWFHEKIDGGTVCRVCKNMSGSLGPGYGCPECRFYIHNTCSDLPKEILHPSHPFHPLEKSSFTTFLCPLCLEGCSSFRYRCNLCDFQIDTLCAFSTDSEKFKSLGPILPHIHHHPLLLVQPLEEYELRCRTCWESCNGLVYGCLLCDFFLHKSCALLTCVIRHPSHPDHLMEKLQHRRFKCSNCLIDREGMPYHCPSCETFYLDSRCAFEFEGRELVYHEKHRHLLEVFERNLDDDEVNELECMVCREPCLGTTYGCQVCGFFLHKLCTDLPEFLHPAHPFHPLKRDYGRYFQCHGCLEHCEDAVCYYCEQCDFYLEYECAFVVPRSEYESKQYILHDIHRHPLTLNEKEDRDDGVDCAACGSRCSGPTFQCGVCNFVVHRSCMDLPETILKPQFHRTDSLQLIKTIAKFTCNVCLKDCNGLHYTCSGSSCSCSLKVDITCAFAEHSIITCERHSHPLIFLEEIDGNKSLKYCSECREPCVSSVFHCPTCDFKLDLLCGPLPCSLKLEIHYENLELMDHYVVDVRIGECYCDICEEMRDPWARVYYCSRCSYHAEIKCVMPELVHAFSGKSGDVELRGPGRWSYRGKVISKASMSEEMQYMYTDAEPRNDLALAAEMEMKEIVQSLTGDERNQLENIFNSSDELFDDLNGEGNNADAPDDWPYSDEAFSKLVRRIVSYDNMRLRKCWEEQVKFVRVRNCMVPEKLVPVFNDLYRKHGDVSEGLPLSQGMKALLFLYFCRAVESMSGTAVADVTEDALKGWWSSLRAVRQAGMRVQFAVDVLKRVVLAHFGLQASKYEADFNQKIKLLSDSIKEKNALLEEIKGKKEKHVDDIGSGKSSLIDYSLNEASLLKYRNAGDVVLGYHPF